MKKLLRAFNTQRWLNASICLGLAEGAMEEAVKYLRDREAFGHPIGDFQGMRWKAADMYIEIEAGRGLLYRERSAATSSRTRLSRRWRKSTATRWASA